MRALPQSRLLVFCYSFLFVVVEFLTGCKSTPAGRNAFNNRGGFPNRNPYVQSSGLEGFGVGFAGVISPKYAVAFFLIGALLGAFFSQRAKRFRKWILAALFTIAAVVFLTMGAPLAYAGWLILGFVLAWIALRVAALAKPRSTLFGSAEWANRAHILEKDLCGESGLMLGNFVDSKGTLPLYYRGDRHLLTIAPTRAGKGIAAIIPNLLTYKGSTLVIDPKGENAMITARQRRSMGQTVHIVDPWGITKMEASRFNPLVWLDREDEDISENALMLADAMIVRSGKGESGFWEDEAAALLWGLILYVALDTTPNIDRSLGGVRDLINYPEEKFTALMKTMYQHENDIISSTAARTLGKEPKVLSSVLATLQSHTHFLDSPRMRHTLRGSDFKFEDLKAKKMTIYLVLPADRLNSFGRWLRLLIQQAITVNARNIDQKPDKPILFMLDEMAALGRLTKVEEAFGLMAGFGMQLWGIAQDASQLKRIYGDGWETFVANSGVLQYFGSRDERTSSYFSKLCGVGTEVKESQTRSISTSAQGQASGSSRSWTTDHVQRQLAFPDELMRVHESKELLLIENHNPIMAVKLAWFKDPRLMQLGDNLQSRKEPARAANL